MSSKPMETKGAEGPYLEGLGDDWEPKDDLAASIADNQRVKEERRIAALRRRKRFRLTIIVLSIISVVVGLLITRSYLLRNKEAELKNPQGFSVVIEPEANLIGYTLKKATITLPNEGIFDLQRYELDRHTFVQKETTLNEEELFPKTLSEISSNLEDSWLIIFAGASVEGTPSDNRDLCRDRVVDVANVMRQMPNLSAHKYWGIPAGEKKLFDSQGRQLDEKEEEVIPKEELDHQRVLIIIAIRPRNAQTSSDSTRPSQRLIEVLYDNNLLPSDYDYPGKELAPL